MTNMQTPINWLELYEELHTATRKMRDLQNAFFEVRKKHQSGDKELVAAKKQELVVRELILKGRPILKGIEVDSLDINGKLYHTLHSAVLAMRTEQVRYFDDKSHGVASYSQLQKAKRGESIVDKMLEKNADITTPKQPTLF